MDKIINNDEVWVAVDGYQGLYEISNMGNIRSLDRAITERGTNRTVCRKGKLLKPGITDGYYGVRLGRGGVIRTYKLHRLVASAFVAGKSDKKPVTNHKNGDKLDNRAENLEWCTVGYNLQHAYDTGLKKGAYYPRKQVI